MICIFFEGSQYVPVLEKVIGGKMKVVKSETPYGNADILFSPCEKVMCIPNAGLDFGNDSQKAPKAVMYTLVKYKVRQMCIISKVGGINKLMHVGDTVIPDDYIDKTTIYCKSFLNEISELPPRYDMLDVFSGSWRGRIKKHLVSQRGNTASDIFDKGVYVCTDGPGFESSAEIEQYRRMDIDVVGHYLSPYVYYARELAIAIACISIVSNSFCNNDEFLKEDETTAGIFKSYIEAAIQTANDNDGEEQKKHWIKNIKTDLERVFYE